ncbi:hypothetical protein [Streptomyces sp. NPDC056987]|uniref:hypothetical protein n=1 Tax=Streptomyces sp. NPDC056987 TaxID=3345988 RepID=UPI0036282484
MPHTIPLPRRAPESTLLTPAGTSPLNFVIVTETHHFVIENAACLIRCGKKLAKSDPGTARQHGWNPATRMNAVLAFRLLLADSDPVEIAERAGQYGLRVRSVSTLASNATDDSTLYEDEISCDDA